MEVIQVLSQKDVYPATCSKLAIETRHNNPTAFSPMGGPSPHKKKKQKTIETLEKGVKYVQS